ncbi:DUF3011 domain-containing protein [bacterium]|nr:DUF3011 domain-containing protein [bacterium]
MKSIYLSKKFIAATGIVSASVVLFFFTNAGTFNDQIDPAQIVADSQRLSVLLSNNNLSDIGKRTLRQYKIKFLNYLSAVEHLRSCQEILNYDSTMETGIYKLYPTGSASQAHMMICDISTTNPKTLIKQADLGPVIKEETCADHNNCNQGDTLFEEMSCSTTTAAKKYCAVDNVFGSPFLVHTANGSSCKEADYGYEEGKGLWVQNACSGTFRLRRNVSNTRIETKEQIITCESMSTADAVCRVDGTILGEVTVMQRLSTSACTKDVSYSNDDSAIYVRAGCRAQFKVTVLKETSILSASQIANNEQTHQVVPSSAANGFLDSASLETGHLVLRGWVCEISSANSLQVIAYQGNRGSGGVIIGSGVANVNHEAGVTNACRTTGVGHRFVLTIPLTSQLISGSPVSVFGVANNSANTLYSVKKSHTVDIPVMPITGNIDRVTNSGTQTVIEGWACQQGVHASIDVHVYVGGAAGQGQMIAMGKASNTAETAVSTACKTTGVPHRFSVSIAATTANAHVGKKIFVHGISLIKGNPNALISRAGVFSIPSSGPTVRPTPAPAIPKTSIFKTLSPRSGSDR